MNKHESRIKMIVCDIDGTLLNKEEIHIKEEIKQVIESIKDKGVVFAVASGRQYNEMYDIMGMDDIYYISSDGGAVVFKNKVLKQFDIPGFSLNNIISNQSLCKSVIFHGVSSSYCEDVLYKKEREKCGASLEIVNIKEEFKNKDIRYKNRYLEFLKDKSIIKIAKYGAVYAETPPNCRVVYKKGDITEWIRCDADKGRGVGFLQEMLNIKISETAVFGDNVNDFGLLRRGGYKYVIKNSPLDKSLHIPVKTDNITKEFKSILRQIG